MEVVRDASYPRLRDASIQVQPLRSDFVFYQARFSFCSYFFNRRLHYLMGANSLALDRLIPPEAMRAILAHELAHVNYYQVHNRIQLLGLLRLVSPSFAARFERKADLDAIDLGYGPGLALFRRWLYANIPPSRIAAKKRNYLTPEEIEAVLDARQHDPEIMSKLMRSVPRNLRQIEALVGHSSLNR